MGTLCKGIILNDTYKIIDVIGSGSFGAVFRAEHLRLQIDVVVKKLHDDVTDISFVHREAEILKKLKHPYLPMIYDLIQVDKDVYIIMDYISGENLATVLDRIGKFPEEQVRKWALQLGEALAYLHGQNPPIIHSDIKPTNIMLTESGDICLIDFNVSLAVGKTKASAISGVPGYSPPEQYHSIDSYVKILEERSSQATPRRSEKGRDEATRYQGVAGRDAVTVYQGTAGRDEATVYQGTAGRDETTEYQGTAGRDEATVYQSVAGRDEATVYQGVAGRDEATVYQGAVGRDEVTVYQGVAGRDEATTYMGNGGEAAVSMIKEATRGYAQYIGIGMKEYSDVYSLGATLYRLLTGKNVSFEMRRKDIEKELSSYVSDGFMQILLTMLEIAPEDRYSNGAEFLEALRNSGEDPTAKRKKLLIQIMIAGTVFVVIVIVALMVQRERRINSSEYYSLLQQAEVEIGNGNFARATSLIDSAQVHSEERIEAYEKELYLLYTMEEFEKCVEIGQAYINAPIFEIKSKAEKQSYGNILYTTAKAYQNLAQYENAILLYPVALEYVSNNSAYFRDYAICLIKMGRISEAQEQLDIGLELELKQDSLYMVQGELAFAQKDYQGALSYFMQCYESTSDADLEKRSVLNYVQACKEQGNEKIVDEISILEKYMEKHSETTNLLIVECLADAYVRIALLEESNAAQYYERALELFQIVYESGYKTYQIQENIAILYENMGDLEEAEEVLLRLSKDYPDKYQIYKRLAYLEADKQQKTAEEDRNYRNMLHYYEHAVELYQDKEQDMEMDMLQYMIEELKNGGWL